MYVHLRQRALLLLPAILMLAASASAQSDTKVMSKAQGDDADPPKTTTSSSPGDQAGTMQDVPTLPSLEEMLAVAQRSSPEVRLAEARLQQARLGVLQKITLFRRQWQEQVGQLQAAQTELRQLQATSKDNPGNKALLQSVRVAQLRIAQLREDLSAQQTELQLLLGTQRDRLKKKTDTARQKLIKDRLLPQAEQVLQLKMQEHRTGSAGVSEVYEWSSRVMQANRSLAPSKEKQVAAIESHRKMMEQLAKVAEARFRTGKITQSEVAEAQYYVAEADLWLLEARGK